MASTNLVVKASLSVEIIKEGGICRSAPEIHVRNFEVTPD